MNCVSARRFRRVIQLSICLFPIACGGAASDRSTTQGATGGNTGGDNARAGTSANATAGAKTDSGAATSSTVGGAVENGGTRATGTGGATHGTTPSTSTGGAGASAAQEPIDDRPARPAWTPAFTTALGSPGWMQSTAPICESTQGLGAAFDVWADARGVFAMFADTCNIFAGVSCEKTGASLKYNSGSGWQLVYQFTPGSFVPGFRSLWGGFADGPMLMTGVVDGKDGGHFVDKSGVAYQADAKGANVAFVVGKDLAYVSDGANILSYAAGSWTKLGQSTSKLLGIWADTQTVIAVGEDQTVLMKSATGALAPIAGVPAGTYTAVWAFAANDIWVGNSSAQLVHYDGATWRVIATGSRDISGSGIRQLWGAAGAVYFITAAEMGRWNGTNVEMLLQPPQGVDMSTLSNQFGGIWGRSANEVFVAMRDRKYADFACGSVFMLWFDGTQFHQF